MLFTRGWDTFPSDANNNLSRDAPFTGKRAEELGGKPTGSWSHGYWSKVRANVALLRTFVFKVLAGLTVRVRFGLLETIEVYRKLVCQ